MGSPEYKIHQWLYNRLKNSDDILYPTDYRVSSESEQIIKNAVEYFMNPASEITYPSKSYAVAIIYSYLIHKNFGTPFFESLSDSDLLCGNDRYFKPYEHSVKVTSIFDRIIETVGVGRANFKLNTSLSQVKATLKYFNQEFGLTT